MSLFFFLLWVMGFFFLLWHILCFCFVCKGVWMLKRSSILLTYTGESDGENLFFSLTQVWVTSREFIFLTYAHESYGENFFFPHFETRAKLLFWFSLQGSCGGPKRVLFFSLVTWVEQQSRIAHHQSPPYHQIFLYIFIIFFHFEWFRSLTGH